MKTMMIVSLAFATMVAIAAEPTTATTNANGKVKMSAAERIDKFLGGMVTKPGSQQGQIVFVNCQKRAGVELIKEVISELNVKPVYNMILEDGAFSLPQPKIHGTISLYIVDDPSMPTLLSAPEDRWAMVNIARLGEGRGSQAGYFNARVKKELTRGYCLLAGTQDSNYKNSLLGCKTKPEDLDLHIDCRLPVDIQQRMKEYLPGYGVLPAHIVPYSQAVREGWAANPTNDVQKRVWDKIHAMPNNPIKIKYDPKKGK